MTLPPSGSHPEDLLRELAPQVLGVLTRRYGDFDAAEDAVQEALIAASRHWPVSGPPDNPRAWLIQTAGRRLIDRWRSEAARREREELAVRQAVDPVEVTDTDDTVLMLFLCCHPSLRPSSAVALTLRAVGGLSTAEIAHAYLVPEATMAQRISRAKKTVKSSGIPLRPPPGRGRAWSERLRSVLHVLYLVFNEGYTSSAGPDLSRVELSGEAIRLTRIVHRHLPDDPEVAGLLALMLLTDARRPARVGPDNELVPLAGQDRGRWDRALIAEGVALISAALAQAAIGEYQLQAAIAAAHDQAPSVEGTDWSQILTLYGLLERMTGNPMVTLNRAVAAAMVHGPASGLRLLEPLDERLGQHHRLDAVRGHLYELAGDVEAAARHYRAAAGRTTSLPEQRYLLLRAARLRAVSDRTGTGGTAA